MAKKVVKKEKRESTRRTTHEENLSIRNSCVSCGHYHAPASWVKHPLECVVKAADADGCACTPKDFVSRTFKGSYA